MISDTLAKAEKLIESINVVERNQQADISSRDKCIKAIEGLKAKIKENEEGIDIATHAIEILKGISDKSVQEAYSFLEGNINKALERMFINTTRQIKLREYVRTNQYPQLEIELTVEGGRKRSLKTDSGHGLAQIVSLLSILSLIVITRSRRILVMDEIISGLDIRNREIISEILWSFTEIGFQFIVNEHGFIPKGAKVYNMAMSNGIGRVDKSYIEENGVYLQGEELENGDSLISSEEIENGVGDVVEI